jgi:hypothetical protein
MGQVNIDRNKSIIIYKEKSGWGATIITGNDVMETHDHESEGALLHHIADIYEEALT